MTRTFPPRPSTPTGPAMLSTVVYNQENEPDGDDDVCDPARQLFLFVAVAVGALAGGLALGFLMDWIQGRF